MSERKNSPRAAMNPEEEKRLRSIEVAARAYISARHQWDKGTLAARTEYDRLVDLERTLGMERPS